MKSITDQMFVAAIRQIIRPLLYLPSPELILKAGAPLIETETELMLKKQAGNTPQPA